MGLVSILMVVLTNIFLSALDLQLISSQTSSVEQEGRYVLTRLTYDVRRASAITVPNSNELVLTISSAPYDYTISNGQLLLTVNGGTPAQLNEVNTTISNVSFTRLINSVTTNNLNPKPSVQIKFTISSGSETRDYETTISTR